MKDIVERLREWAGYELASMTLMPEAADEIERLRNHLEFFQHEFDKWYGQAQRCRMILESKKLD